MLFAHEEIGWPERADEVWQNRARALLRYSPNSGRPVVTAHAMQALARHARVGWDNALAWLDQLADERAALANAANVIDLASRRASEGLAR